jgi:hypothetical protein
MESYQGERADLGLQSDSDRSDQRRDRAAKVSDSDTKNIKRRDRAAKVLG